MARTFRIDMGTIVSPHLLLARARRAASKNGVTLVGDERSGRFSHSMVRGEYRVIGRTVLVTIIDKYSLLPWSVVEGRLRRWFSSGSSPLVREESTVGTARLARGRIRSGRPTRRRRRRSPHR
jgi:hypothetical protein